MGREYGGFGRAAECGEAMWKAEGIYGDADSSAVKVEAEGAGLQQSGRGCRGEAEGEEWGAGEAGEGNYLGGGAAAKF